MDNETRDEMMYLEYRDGVTGNEYGGTLPWQDKDRLVEAVDYKAHHGFCAAVMSAREHECDCGAEWVPLSRDKPRRYVLVCVSERHTCRKRRFADLRNACRRGDEMRAKGCKPRLLEDLYGQHPVVDISPGEWAA